jgi:hypothetical protein
MQAARFTASSAMTAAALATALRAGLVPPPAMIGIGSSVAAASAARSYLS